MLITSSPHWGDYFFLNGKHYCSNLLRYHTQHFVFISFPIRSIERDPITPSGTMIFINIHMMSDAPCFSYPWVSKSSAATTTSVWSPWGIYLPAAAAAANWSRGPSIIKTPHRLNNYCDFFFFYISLAAITIIFSSFFLMIDLSYQTHETIFHGYNSHFSQKGCPEYPFISLLNNTWVAWRASVRILVAKKMMRIKSAGFR